MRVQGTTWRPTSWSSGRTRSPARAVVLHTNGGPSSTPAGSLFGFFEGNRAAGVMAHFQVPWSGPAEQYADTDVVCWAAYSASTFAVQIETQDDGNPDRPWSGSQVAEIVRICRALQVPPRLLDVYPSDGLGWHAEYGDWNHGGHNCPGPVRLAQLHGLVLPQLGGLRSFPSGPRNLPPWPGRLLGLGSSGADVAMYQSRMIQRGWNALRAAGGADGQFGPATDLVTRQFQVEKGLVVDGLVGRDTWGAAWLEPV